MSVIVLGMEMPENCHVCGLCFGGLCYAIPPEVDEMCPDEDRPDWCPLRPLPEKHGRLVDVDAMERLMSDTVQGDIRGYPYSDTQWDMAFKWLDHQPTIVEAEGDET